MPILPSRGQAETPVERPVPISLPALETPMMAQPGPSRLARESRLLASAIAKLRQDGQPEQALAILDQHRSEFDAGVLAPEANATRIEALLRLGRNGQALALLDGQRLSAQGLGREMLIARAELRADKGRTSAAFHDFDLIVSTSVQTDAIAERALYGRATCRAKSGDWDGARDDFKKYINTFPQGRFAREARSALAPHIQ
jgi:TolA-binding protein